MKEPVQVNTRHDTPRPPQILRNALGILLLLLLAVPALAGPTTDATATALPHLVGDSAGVATDINNRGDVSGRSEGTFTTAVKWDKNGTANALLPLPGDFSSFGEAINEHGDVVGISHSGQGSCAELFGVGVDTAVVWDRHGATRTLRPMDGDDETRGYGINNNGITVGISIARRPDCTGAFTAVMWDRDGNPTPLASPSAVLDETFGYDVNESGVVAGFNNTFSGSAFNATVWDRQGVPTNLATFSGASFELASGLNNKGEVVGTDFISFTGLIWDKWGNPTTLVPFGTDIFSTAVDVNNRSHVVGSSFSGAFTETAVIWDNQGVAAPLAPLPGDTGSSGLGINDRGHAVGFSSGSAGTTAVVWR
jgi:hypothetical protein